MRSKKNPLVMPVVKWVGGKRQLLADLTPLMPNRITSYCEPFVGGGAVLFSLCPSRAYINDINEELINVYEVIRDNVNGLISLLQEHRNEKEYFYEVRDWDRDHEKYQQLDKKPRIAQSGYRSRYNIKVVK